MNEQTRPTHELSPGGGGISALFDDDEEQTRHLVMVASGPYAERLPVTNMSVGEVRARFSDRFDIDPRSVAVLDGHDVNDATVVRAGQVLMFMHRAGEKGGCRPYNWCISNQMTHPHPDPLPSDGRGNSLIRLLHILRRLDTPTDGARFSLSHPMGEGRGEGERASKSEVVFARVLN